MKVLVIGATGALGRPAVKLLRERGVSVRALNRHPEQAADLAAAGAETVAGDLVDADSLRSACAGIDRVLVAAHGMMGRGRWRSEAVDDAGHRALFAIARDAGVERIAYVSAFGVGPDHPIDFFRTKHTVEAALAASGIAHIILRPTAFMEHHVHRFNGQAVLDKGKAKLVGAGTKPRNFVCAGDVAELAVHSLLQDPAPFDLLEIGGPGHYTNAEIAALYARSAGIAPRASHLPPAVARVMSMLIAPFHPGIARIMRLLALPDDAFSERFDGAADLERRFSFKLTTVEDFIAARVREARAARR